MFRKIVVTLCVISLLFSQSVVISSFAVDVAAPALKLSTPKNNQQNVDVKIKISLKFSENIYKAKYFTRIKLLKAGKAVSIKRAISKNFLKITPVSSLKFKTIYKIQIPAYSIKDKSGNAIKKAITIKFTTFSQLIFSDGHYEGAVLNGEQNGTGLFTYKNGDSYYGHWSNGYRSGYGTYNWKDGSKYQGYWNLGLRSGYGVYTWADKSIYKGYWINDKKNGYGIIDWINGDEFVGDFKNDMRDGLGTYTWANGEKYVGSWVKGNRTGYGEYYFSNGKVKYVGHWTDNKKDGYIMEFDETGKYLYTSHYIMDVLQI